MISLGEIENLTLEHVKLYDLIFKRSIASQMKSIKIKVVKHKVKAFGYEKEIELNSEILEDGFNLILPIKTYRLNEGVYKISDEQKSFNIHMQVLLQ